MGKVHADMSMSLDGFVAGDNAGPQNALGDGGHRIQRWLYDLESWRERQSREGGQRSQDDEVFKERSSGNGAYVMGKRMFDEGEVGWGDPPPFGAPVFVLTRHDREPWVRQGGTTFTFVTDGIESALEHARAAAGEKDIQIAGGADIVRQYLEAGMLDELQIHLSPVLLGDGVRLFDGIDTEGSVKLEVGKVIASRRVTHLSYRVVK